MQMIADKVVDSITDETVRLRLKKRDKTILILIKELRFMSDFLQRKLAG